MKYAFYPLGLLLAAAALTGCLFGNSSDGSANPGEVTQTIPYRVEGNTIITGPYSYYGSYCNEDVLHKDSSLVEENTIAFKVEGSTLSIIAGKDTLESGAVIQQVVVFARQGSGSGLQGLWSGANQEFRVVSGTPTETENAELEDDQKFFARYRAYSRSWFRFAGGKIISYLDRESAKRFIADWNGEFNEEKKPDSARYAITVKALDKYTVELKGRENGETVRFTQNSEGATYSSDMPGHAFHRYFSEPKSCPNEYTPEWYGEFMDANLKVTVLEKGFGPEKSAEIHPKSGNPRHFPFGPLKTAYSLLN